MKKSWILSLSLLTLSLHGETKNSYLYEKIQAMERAKINYAGLYREVKLSSPLELKECLLDHDKRLAREVLDLETRRFRKEISMDRRDKFILIHLVGSMLYSSFGDDDHFKTFKDGIIRGTPLLFDYENGINNSPLHAYFYKTAEKEKILPPKIKTAKDLESVENHFTKEREKIKKVTEMLIDDQKLHILSREMIVKFFERQNSVALDLCKGKKVTVGDNSLEQLLGTNPTQVKREIKPYLSDLALMGWHSFATFYDQIGEGKVKQLLSAYKINRTLSSASRFQKEELLQLFTKASGAPAYCVSDLLDLYAIEDFLNESEEREAKNLKAVLIPEKSHSVVYNSKTDSKRYTITQIRERGHLKTEVIGEDGIPIKRNEKEITPLELCSKIKSILEKELP